MTLVLLLLPIVLFVVGATVFLAMKRKPPRKQLEAVNAPEPARPPTEDRQPLRGAETLSKPKRNAKVHEVVEQITEGLPGDVYASVADDRVEWRGTVKAYDTRVLFERMKCTLSMKAGHAFGQLGFNWDKKKKHSDKKPAPWTDGDLTEVFVGPGVYFRTWGSDADEILTRFGELPEEIATRIVASMSTDQVSELWIRDDGTIEVEFSRPANEIWKLTEKVRHQIELLGDVAIALKDRRAPSADAPQETTPDAQGARHTLTCRYCKTLYFFTPSVAGCPNCGAPAEATDAP